MLDPVQLPLRDIHRPPAVSAWPPAPGWWLLLIFGVVLCAVVWWLRRRHTRPGVKKLALRELSRLRDDASLTAIERLRQLSVLLRRVCLSVYPRADSAGLTGQAWLRFLDQPLDDQRFTHGPGHVLIDEPYRPDGHAEFDALFALCQDWIEALPRRVS